MLEFTLASPKRFLNDIVTLAEPGNSRRVLADRRVAASKDSSMPRKRRRHDGLNSGKRAPLEW